MTVTRENVLNAFQFRHACREFDTNRKISDGDFSTILEAGRLSPSSFGFEPWKFLVVQNPALRERLKAVAWGAQSQLTTASHFMVVLARKRAAMEPHSDYIQMIWREVHRMPADLAAGYTAKYDEFLHKDFALYENERACFEWSCRQCYIALGNMLTVAAMLGIDSGGMEGFGKEGIESLLAGEGLLDREVHGVACLAAFGYRVQDPKRPKTRRPADQVVQWVK